VAPWTRLTRRRRSASTSASWVSAWKKPSLGISPGYAVTALFHLGFAGCVHMEVPIGQVEARGPVPGKRAWIVTRPPIQLSQVTSL